MEGISYGVADLEHMKNKLSSGSSYLRYYRHCGVRKFTHSRGRRPRLLRGDGVLPRRAWEGGVLSKDMDMVSEYCLPAIMVLGRHTPLLHWVLGFGDKSPFHHTFFHDAGRRRSRDRWVDGLGGKSGQRWPLSEPLPRWPQLLCLWWPSRRAEEACATRLALG